MILIVDNGSKHVPEIQAILRKYKIKYVTKSQSTLSRMLDTHHYKGFILSGGGPNLDKEIKFNRIRANVSVIINHDKPILGICEGHEIIGFVSGGEINRMPKRYKNPANKITLKKRSKIFKGLPKTIYGYEAHRAYVRDVPRAHFDVAAYSDKNGVEALFHKKKPIFTTQFHPEASGYHGEIIIKNFLEICYNRELKSKDNKVKN